MYGERGALREDTAIGVVFTGVGILNSVVSLTVYLRVIVPMYGRAKETPVSPPPVVVLGVTALVFTIGVGLAAQVLLGQVA